MLSDFERTTSGFGTNYSLGIMPECFSSVNGTKDENQTCIFGHLGEDWGSKTHLAGYNRAYQYGITVSQISWFGMNCDLKGDDFRHYNYAMNEPDCLIMDLTNQLLSNGTSLRLNCPQTITE